MQKALILSIIFSISLFAQIQKEACTGCHGENLEKQALGYSAIVADLTHETIANALKGYKNHTYGGNLKGLMDRVGAYSDEDIDSFSKTIGKDKY